jgi:hypothetical protein
MVRTNFNITLNGYLIPDTLNKKLASPANKYSIAQIIFGIETSGGTEEFSAKVKRGNNANVKSVLLNDSVNTINTINNYGTTDPAILTYINTNKSITGTFVSSTTVSFSSGWLIAPSSLPSTTVANFSFFINGQYVEQSSIVSFTDNSTNSVLVLNTTLLGYSLESDDVIIGIGKFN